MKHLKKTLKTEYNKGNHLSQIIFHIFCILLILILQLFFLINFPERKLSKIKSNKENVLILYHKLHNFNQSFYFLSKLFKTEG